VCLCDEKRPTRRGGRKERRKGGRGSAKCLGVCGMASLPYVQRRWKSSHARVPLRLDMQTKDDAGHARTRARTPAHTRINTQLACARLVGVPCRLRYLGMKKKSENTRGMCRQKTTQCAVKKQLNVYHLKTKECAWSKVHGLKCCRHK
jgi:hypothetical protein